MENKKDSELPSTSSAQEDTTQKDRVVDMMLGKSNMRVIDSETMIQETQKRIWNSLKKGIEYDATVDRSDAYLRKHVHEKQSMVVMYVDLVGSTNITLTLPEEKVAIIISSFAQEMAFALNAHGGFVLKFVGDAVIGYFVHASSLIAADNAISAAKSMIKIIEEGINPILNQYDYPDLFIKIGIDFGTNMIVRYGSDAEKSHVDLLGPAMNIAAKIQAKAKPQEILIGEDVYNRIHPSLRKEFSKKIWNEDEWKYNSRETGELYPVYYHSN
ncbi:MAG: adenylate/guanylate cyclase domain-containing protein [Crenarchaeota archaeon]|nr:adenylate/guanylate cyclase domain-containing protein [Thermoproteota archaeon]MDA1124384.1 adenylate/guanylate cyclase domain-containing protein [Thermoproteota archaeon]